MDHLDHIHGEHTHDHDHEHPHTHAHAHPHEHGHGGEKTVAVLRYMLDHNVHHAAELGDLAKEFSGEVAHQLMHAVEAFDQANGYLSAALDMLEK